MAQDIPVYLFTGFMDSGKTTLVEETLFENNFGDGSKGHLSAGTNFYRVQRHLGDGQAA